MWDIGQTEKDFLYLIGDKDLSAYSIFCLLKETNKPISYKNVHKTLKKLSRLMLIQIVPGKFKRNAKYYRLRTPGVFQILLTCPINIPFLIKYKDDPILKIILYQFFELSTIKYFDTIPREYFLTEYLNQCAKRTVEEIQKGDKFTKEMKADTNISYVANFVAKKQVKIFIYDIVAMNKISRFRTGYYGKFGSRIFDFVINKDGDYPNYPHHDYTRVDREHRTADPNYQKLFPNQVLKNDKKFMSVFEKMKEEFETGCKDFI